MARIFYKAFFGALLGRAVGSVLIAILTFLAIGPDRLVALVMGELPDWVTPSGVRWTLGVLALLFLALTYGPWLVRKFQKQQLPIDFTVNATSWGARAHMFENEEADPSVYDFGDVTFTNISPDRRVSLHIRMWLKSEKSGLNLPIVAGGTYLRASIDRHGFAAQAVEKHNLVPTAALDLPIKIEPGNSVKGRLVFLFDAKMIRENVLPLDFKGEVDKTFEIKDLVSGKVISIPAQIGATYRGDPNA